MVRAKGTNIGPIRLAYSDQQKGRLHWTIGNDSRFKSGSDDWVSETGSMKMSIFATPKGENPNFKDKTP